MIAVVRLGADGLRNRDRADGAARQTDGRRLSCVAARVPDRPAVCPARHVRDGQPDRGERIVPELIQDAFTPEAVAARGGFALDGSDNASRESAQGLAGVRRKLGGPGASRRAAEADSEDRGENMRAVLITIVLSLDQRGGARHRRLCPPISASSRTTRWPLREDESWRWKHNGPTGAEASRRSCQLETEAYLKGSLGETVQFRVPGGSLGRFRNIVVGAPQFTIGQRVIRLSGQPRADGSLCAGPEPGRLSTRAVGAGRLDGDAAADRADGRRADRPRESQSASVAARGFRTSGAGAGRDTADDRDQAPSTASVVLMLAVIAMSSAHARPALAYLKFGFEVNGRQVTLEVDTHAGPLFRQQSGRAVA